MKHLPLSVFRSVAFIGTAALSSCDKRVTEAPAPSGSLTIEYRNVVGTAPLVLNSDTYTTALGQQFTVSTFNYYVSNIRLRRADGTEYSEPESYHLIRESDAASKRFTLQNIPAGRYTGFTFTLGVDSARNVAGAQTGALDVSNGMFWTWNSGYIYTKLEGRSPQAGGNQQLLFHIGGFQTPSNAIRTLSPTLNGATMQVGPGLTPTIQLEADILNMFTGPNPINFTTLSNTMTGTSAVLVADNQAAGMFRVAHFHAN